MALSTLAALLLASVACEPPASPPAASPQEPVPVAQESPWTTPSRVDVAFTKHRPSDAPAPRDADEAGLEALGRLVYSRVSIDAQDRPIQEVLTALSRALGVNLLPFFEGEGRPAPRLGISLSCRINLFVHEVDGRSALEAIAAQCGPEVTWQINRGMIEFGPRESLAREDARSTKVYEVTDLALEAPYFSPGGCEIPGNRLRPKDVVADLVRAVSEQCEPLAFEPAPPPTEAEIAEGVKRQHLQHSTPATGSTPNPRQAVNTTATRNLDPSLGPVFVKGQWAQINVKDHTLVVTGPDFVHRAIDGYPPPLPPRLK